MSEDVSATLTCSITGLDSSTAATVVWKEGANTLSDDGSYTVTQGSVSGTEQASTLQITAAKLSELRGSDSPATKTFTCQVTSGQYPNSAQSSSTMNLKILEKMGKIVWLHF